MQWLLGPLSCGGSSVGEDVALAVAQASLHWVIRDF